MHPASPTSAKSSRIVRYHVQDVVSQPAFRHVELPNPSPPPDSRKAQLLRLLLALVNAHLSNPHADIPRDIWDEVVETGEVRDEWRGRPGLAQFQSAVLAELAIAEGRMSPSERWMGPNADPRWLRMFQLPLPDSMSQLFGDWDGQAQFHPGFALLEEYEARVMYLMLEATEEKLQDGTSVIRPLQTWEIARRMEPKRRRFIRKPELVDGEPEQQQWLPVETVERYLRSARAKLVTLLESVA